MRTMFLLTITSLLLMSFSLKSSTIPNESKISGKIEGTVKSTNEVLSFASVAIYRENSKEEVASVLADNDGYFCFENLSPGKYYVVSYYFGYKKFYSDLLIITDESNELSINDIILLPEKANYTHIEITANKV